MTCRRPDARRGRRTTPAGLLAGLLAAFVLAACAPPPPGQVASDEPRGGIGGTGITTGRAGDGDRLRQHSSSNGVADRKPDGRSAGSGRPDRLAESPLGPIALAEGQVVEALAAPGPEGPAARRVAVVWPLRGAGDGGPPATAISGVMGVPVRPGRRGDPAAAAGWPPCRRGDRVSGQRSVARRRPSSPPPASTG